MSRVCLCKRLTAAFAALMIAALFSVPVPCARAEEAERIYLENEWNYVDGSMDVSAGIPDFAEGVLDRIKRTGVLRVATEPYYPPQEFIDPDLSGQDQYVGPDMELARLIAERMGVGLEIVPLEFVQVLPALAEDQCDLAISALSFTPARAVAYSLSKGYYFSDNAVSSGFIIREEDREKLVSTEDFADRVMIAQSASLQESLAANHVRSYREFRRVSSVQTVYDEVQQGRADVGAVDVETAEAYIRNNPDCGLCLVDQLFFSLEDEYLGDRIAAKKGELQLMYFVNGVIDEVLESDTYTKWLEAARKRAAELGL